MPADGGLCRRPPPAADREALQGSVAGEVLGRPLESDRLTKGDVLMASGGGAVSAPYEPRQLIDGKLVESSTGATFDNVNPATEEVLGQVYDASPDDVGDAIGAARRAFDETTWSTDPAFRARCMTQLGEAMAR